LYSWSNTVGQVLHLLFAVGRAFLSNERRKLARIGKGYAGVDGASLWETRYTGKDSIRNEHASNSRCLGLTFDGSVLITGGSDCAYERATTFLESRAMATVKYAMTQVAYPTPVVLALALSPEGARLRFTGDVGRTYRLQLAASPDGPWHTFTRVETAGCPTLFSMPWTQLVLPCGRAMIPPKITSDTAYEPAYGQ
jgi:hypothetical protein